MTFPRIELKARQIVKRPVERRRFLKARAVHLEQNCNASKSRETISKSGSTHLALLRAMNRLTSVAHCRCGLTASHQILSVRKGAFVQYH